MPEDTTTQTDPSQDNSQGETPVDFDTWFESQPQAIKEAISGHVTGLKSALKSERDRAKKLEDAEKARQRAAQQKEELELAAKEEFKTLADTRQAKIGELESQLTEAQSYQELAQAREKLLKRYVEKEAADLSPAIKKLLKGLPVEQQLEWLTENADALREKKDEKQEKGIPGTPKEGDQRSLTEEQERLARERATRFYHANF